MEIQPSLINEINDAEEMKGVQFMTADEKRKVLRQWDLFLKSGLSKITFGKLLYHHLIQHCSFIAHYVLHGFYATYFDEPEDTIHFLSQFDDRNGISKSVEYGWTCWYTNDDYRDINSAMCRVARKYIPELVKKLESRQRDRDLVRAELLLAKHGIKAEIKEKGDTA